MSQVRRIERSSKSVEVRNHCDVLVIGAGPAGFGAAVTAARRGRKVTLVEYGCKLGGMWTLGLLSPFFDNRHHDGLNAELRSHLQGSGHWGGLWDMSFDPRRFVVVDGIEPELTSVAAVHNRLETGSGGASWKTNRCR